MQRPILGSPENQRDVFGEVVFVLGWFQIEPGGAGVPQAK
jgi:hypothetical protein